MSDMPQDNRTFGLRAMAAGSDLAARVLLDFEQKLFRHNYRQPVLISAGVAGDADDVKTWLGAGAGRPLGYDLAARTLNRLASEAAEPLFLRAALAGADAETREQVRRGLAEACAAADCVYQDGPSGSAGAGENLSVVIVAVGVVERSRMMNRGRFRASDAVLAVGSDRLWPPLVEPARAILAGLSADAKLPKSLFDASPWAQPTPVLAGYLATVLRRYTVKRVVHAMVPVEGDGLEHEGADEGHLRGIGFLIVASDPFAEAIARRLRRRGLAAYRFGRLVPAEAAAQSP